MRLWQLPARALPVTLRPLGGETVISYTRRLSEVNSLAPTAIMRALGQVIPGSGYHLLDHDAWLNDQAIARLEALSAPSGQTQRDLTQPARTTMHYHLRGTRSHDQVTADMAWNQPI